MLRGILPSPRRWNVGRIIACSIRVAGGALALMLIRPQTVLRLAPAFLPPPLANWPSSKRLRDSASARGGRDGLLRGGCRRIGRGSMLFAFRHRREALRSFSPSYPRTDFAPMAMEPLQRSPERANGPCSNSLVARRPCARGIRAPVWFPRTSWNAECSSMRVAGDLRRCAIGSGGGRRILRPWFVSLATRRCPVRGRAMRPSGAASSTRRVSISSSRPRSTFSGKVRRATPQPHGRFNGGR